MTYELTHLKNNIVVTEASKNLVATAVGWNQLLIAAMYFHIIIIIIIILRNIWQGRQNV